MLLHLGVCVGKSIEERYVGHDIQPVDAISILSLEGKAL